MKDWSDKISFARSNSGEGNRRLTAILNQMWNNRVGRLFLSSLKHPVVLGFYSGDGQNHQGDVRLGRTNIHRPVGWLQQNLIHELSHSVLELGIRFEEGRGVERNLDKAKKLYWLAASDSGGTIWVYSPPVGNGTKGRTIPVNSGPRQIGLVEAKKRLERLERLE